LGFDRRSLAGAALCDGDTLSGALGSEGPRQPEGKQAEHRHKKKAEQCHQSDEPVRTRRAAVPSDRAARGDARSSRPSRHVTR